MFFETVSADAVPDTLPGTHHEPGKQRCSQTHDMQRSRARKDPSGQIENQNYRMKDKKQDIQRGQQHRDLLYLVRVFGGNSASVRIERRCRRHLIQSIAEFAAGEVFQFFCLTVNSIYCNASF